MEDTPFFSIIIPTYNRASLLGNAVESVLRQSFPYWELLIIDDGSTDATLDSLQPYLTDARVRYYWQPRRERSAARNRGIDLARGRYCCFLDSDDQYLPRHLQTLHELALETRAPLLRSQYEVRRAGALLHRSQSLPQKQALSAYWDDPHSLLPYALDRRLCTVHRFGVHYIIEDFHLLCRLLVTQRLAQSAQITAVVQEHAARGSTARLPRTRLYQHFLHAQAAIDDLSRHAELRQYLDKEVFLRKRSKIALQYTNRALRSGHSCTALRIARQCRYTTDILRTIYAFLRFPYFWWKARST